MKLHSPKYRELSGEKFFILLNDEQDWNSALKESRKIKIFTHVSNHSFLLWSILIAHHEKLSSVLTGCGWRRLLPIISPEETEAPDALHLALLLISVKKRLRTLFHPIQQLTPDHHK
jgi:hypothetical protein